MLNTEQIEVAFSEYELKVLAGFIACFCQQRSGAPFHFDPRG